MLKKFFLIFLLFLLSGCSIDYSVDIESDVFEENFSIIEKSDNYYYDVSAFRNYNLFYDGSSDLNYTFNELNYDDRFGFTLSGKFNSGNYQKSNLLNSYCGDFTINDDGNTYSIHLSSFNIFDEYSNLDEISFNINTGMNAISNNADRESNGIYNWIINRDNYRNKSIDIVFNKSDIKKKMSYIEGDNQSSLLYVLIFSIIIIVLFILYLVYRFRKNIIVNNDF